MKTKLFSLVLCVLVMASFATAQTALTATTLSAAVSTASTTTIRVASATGLTANNTMLLIDNEILFINSVNGTAIGVSRGYMGSTALPHISGAMVLGGNPQAFLGYDPSGACTNGQGVFQFSPVVNYRTGNQWLCSTVLGKVVPGFQNFSGGPPQVTTAVASAAGQVTPSGPLFHITGALAITGFLIPVGFDPKEGQAICVIPDGTFTTTTANNIALASTAVVNKTLCWTYDGNTAKFTPSY